jgi:hypothetical protein
MKLKKEKKLEMHLKEGLKKKKELVEKKEQKN